ncbi:hypothetical protein SG34_022160 [Thalassomonas viridans]|uniref:Uncharacterized protein n=1 Tax=Thalassomonas viridans TaxID=137584 RepID=A0AAE9Z2I4_9GAMM|nr:hypothetical protein [Thalassomonas viridans]WDE04043.1 hypothetical protein SG34_022160 [Thalassomonas viridans]
MKSLLKPLLLYISLSTLGLCGIVSSAWANPPTEPKVKIVSQIVKVYTMPVRLTASNSQPLNITRDNGLVSLGQLLTKPLLRLPVNRGETFITKPIEKKNQFFEIANIFNDKLQQFISAFSNKEDESFLHDMASQDCETKQDL